MKYKILIILSILLQTYLQSQPQNGDWLISSNFHFKDHFNNLRSDFRLEYSQNWNGNFEIGYFSSSNFLIGLNGDLNYADFETLISDIKFLSTSNSFQLGPYFRNYFGKKGTKSPLFLHLDLNYLSSKQFFRRNLPEAEINTKTKGFSVKVGMGFSVFNNEGMNLDFLMDYQLLKMLNNEANTIVIFDRGRYVFHLNWGVHLSRGNIRGSKIFFPTPLKAGTKSVNFDLLFQRDKDAISTFISNFGFTFFPKNNWAVGIFFPWSTDFVFSSTQQTHFHSTFFSRYYFHISNRFQFFPQLKFDSKLELNHNKNRNGFEEFELTPAYFEVSWGVGLNYFLTPNISVDWVFGQAFRDINLSDTKTKGTFLDSRFNYFF